MLGDQLVQNEISQIMLPFRKEGRPLNTAEQNLLAFQPRCMAWYVTHSHCNRASR